jgi:hypothetical protein
MIYLSGAVRPEFIGVENVGFMLTPNIGNAHPEDAPWAADSGLFSTKGERQFDLDKYIRWLYDRRIYQKDCLFATAPDVVGDPVTTWKRSEHVLPCIRGLGYKAALCAQDGIVTTDIQWDMFDVFFVGGTDAFKLAENTYKLATMAKDRGKWIHMGRVNSARRFRAANISGYDSVDGTFLCFGPDTNFPKLESWLSHAKLQEKMF